MKISLGIYLCDMVWWSVFAVGYLRGLLTHACIFSVSLPHFTHNSNHLEYLCFSLSSKPGRVVGPVMPYENGRTLKDTLTRTAFVSQPVSPNCIVRNNGINQKKSTIEALKDVSQEKPQPSSQSNMATKAAPAMVIDININPYQPQPKEDQLNQRIAIDLKLLQAQTQLGAIGTPAAIAVPASHTLRWLGCRNIGAVWFELPLQGLGATGLLIVFWWNVYV